MKHHCLCHSLCLIRLLGSLMMDTPTIGSISQSLFVFSFSILNVQFVFALFHSIPASMLKIVINYYLKNNYSSLSCFYFYIYPMYWDMIIMMFIEKVALFFSHNYLFLMKTLDTNFEF